MDCLPLRPAAHLPASPPTLIALSNSFKGRFVLWRGGWVGGGVVVVLVAVLTLEKT